MRRRAGRVCATDRGRKLAPEGGDSRTGAQDGRSAQGRKIARTQRRSSALSARAFRLLSVDYPAASAHSGRFQMDMRFDSSVLKE